MLIEQDGKLYMAEGDFGETLPFTFSGEGIEKEDVFKFKVKSITKETLIEKDYKLEENTFYLSFTQEESKILPRGKYKWGLKQYRNDKLINTIVLKEDFWVEKGV